MYRLYIVIIVIALSACTNSPEKVDMLIKNATIYTLDSSMSVVDAMVVHQGKIVQTGKIEELEARYAASEVIDAGGKIIYPGFIDAHCHFWGYGMWLQQANLNGCTSNEDMVARMVEHNRVYHTEWICGRGWDQNLWKDARLPDKSLLNKLFPDKPVVLVRVDGHAVLVNDKALALTGFNPKDFKPAEVVRKDGRLSGVLLENAADFIKNAIPEPSLNERVMALKNAQQDCFNVGLTFLADAGSDLKWITLVDSLKQTGELQMGLYMMLNPGENNIEFIKSGKYNRNGLIVRSLKLYADGALGSRGACLLKPYSDDPENYGIMSNDIEFLRKQCKIAVKYGLQVCTHCIGDSAVRAVLQLYSEFLRPDNDLRWRIEHAQVVNPQDIGYFGRYNIIPSIQTTHATSDMNWAINRLGPERIKHAYAYKQLLDQNVWLPNGSDFPIESINPLFGFYAAVSRTDHNGKPEGGFNPENGLSREEALKAMTIWAAKSMFAEREIGSLEAGKNADFVGLDSDILTCPENTLLKTKVCFTFKEGIMVAGRL